MHISKLAKSPKNFGIPFRLEMEISSFETTAFNRRRVEKVTTTSQLPVVWIRKLLAAGSTIACIVILGIILKSNLLSNSYTGHIITPSRLLVFLTVLLILATPMMKNRGKVVSHSPPSAPQSTRPTPAPVDSHLGMRREVQSPPRPLYGVDSALDFGAQSAPSVHRYTSQYMSGLASVPTRYDSAAAPSGSRRSTAAHHPPAPFVDDVHGTQKHEFAELLPVWARKFEELLIMPQIVIPLVKSLEESDQLLSQVFTQFGLHLSCQGPTPGQQPGSVVYLTDRYLPNPLCNSPDINGLWQRRQLLESLLNVPGFPSHYREYIVSRITTWATRGGLRFSYRHDMRLDEFGPTDSHILAHLIFASLESLIGESFKDRFVINSVVSGGSQSGSLSDEFQSLFSSIGSKASHHSKIVWLEQTARQDGSVKQPLHFNVGTNQRVYGVQPGGGNLIEALCLFFHLVKRLSPTSLWIQIPREVRLVIEAAMGSFGQESGSLTGGFFGLGGGGQFWSKPALGGPGGDSFRGY